MDPTDARFAGSIPGIYERYLVPLMFEPYARDLAPRVGELKQGTLVELAAGTGAVTRALVESLPSAVRIIATDLNQTMLDLAATRLTSPNLGWHHADAQRLPFADGSVDAIVCQFGVMFFPDKPASYREAARVLRSDGLYVFSVWNRLEDNEVSLIADQAVARLFPENPPRFMERTPFGHFDVGALRAPLEAAGFRVGVDTVEKVSMVPSAEHAAIGLCQGTPVRSEIEARDASRLEEATAAVTRALVARFGAGSFENRMSAHVITARRS